MIKPRLFLALAAATFGVLGCSAAGEDEQSEPACEPPLKPAGYDWTADATFPVGPVVLNVTEVSVELMWEPGKDCEGVVHFGDSPDHLSNEVASQAAKGIHHATLAGLQPGTRYFYQVSSCGQSSRVLSMRTAPSAAHAVRFTVWGDNRSDPDTCGKVVNAMTGVQPDFTINTGDIVANGQEWTQYKTEFFDPLRPLGHHVPTFVAIGNHEKEGSGFYTYLDVQRPKEASSPEAFGGTYSFTFGNVFVLVIDTTLPSLSLAGNISSEVSEWIEKTAASEQAQRAKWRIAMGHYPAWSESWSPNACQKYDGTPWVAKWFMPLLSENHFHAYFAGHTHDYERGQVGGVVHIISGGGGAGIDEWCRDLPQIDVYKLEHHFVQVDAGCDQMVIKAISVPGNAVLDTVTVPAD